MIYDIKLDNVINNSTKIHYLCIYNIDNAIPVLFFLLEKQDSNYSFPKLNESHNIIKRAEDLCSKITKHSFINRGFFHNNKSNESYLFLKSTKKVKLTVLNKDEKYKWATIDEICNHNKILDTSIDQNVIDFFYKNTKFMYIESNNRERLSIPKINFYHSDNYIDILYNSCYQLSNNQLQRFYINEKKKYVIIIALIGDKRVPIVIYSN